MPRPDMPMVVVTDQIGGGGARLSRPYVTDIGQIIRPESPFTADHRIGMVIGNSVVHMTSEDAIAFARIVHDVAVNSFTREDF